MRYLPLSLGLLVGCLLATGVAKAEPKPVLKVFILAGQSNMEGKAKLELLDHQIHAPQTKQFFAHLHRNGEYIERDDVWINFLGRRGPLTVGYGSPNCIGPELEFGNIVGDHYDEPVLLIKTAWGGKSIARDFRPPSSGLPADDELNKVLEKTNEQNRKKNRPEVTLDDIKQKYGHFYREMIKEVRATLTELEQRFPNLDVNGYEIAGFVWFQGWNDMYNDYQLEYAQNLANLIRDVRRDLDAPKLPFVIGIMGQNGFQPATGNMAVVKQAQASMERIEEFRDNVKCVATDQYWDQAADEFFPRWRDDFEGWKKVGSDRPYHYLGSALTFCRIGHGFGEAMLELNHATNVTGEVER